MLVAFADWVGPAQTLIYADDQGHIPYHALGRIPIRGDANNPARSRPSPPTLPLPTRPRTSGQAIFPSTSSPRPSIPPTGSSPRPTPVSPRTATAIPSPSTGWPPTAPSASTACWMPAPGNSPEDPAAKSATASSATTPAAASAPGPNETPAYTHLLTPLDMLALQNDVTSGPDRILAQRLAYSIDHTTGPLKNDPTLHQAADILRKWNGSVDANAAAPAIVNAARAALWPMLLIPKLAPEAGTQLVQGADLSKVRNLRADAARAANLWLL